MRLKVLYLYCIEKLCKIIKKDPMQYKLRRYRLYGAKIGTGVRAFSPISSSESYLITIGDDVTISFGVKFITHDNSAIKMYDDATDFVGEIIIGNNVFIGAQTILLPGVTIADNCIIGAGAIVCKSVNTPGSIIAGNPAHIIGNIDQARAKYENNKFDFRGVDRKKTITSNKNRFICK